MSRGAMSMIPLASVLAASIALAAMGRAARAEEPYPLTWSIQYGTVGNEFGEAVAADRSGNVYLGGHTNFNQAPSHGKRDGILTKVDAASGAILWNKYIGTEYDDYVYSVDVDSNDNPYAAGSFDKISGTHGEFQVDVFINKYDSAGGTIWERQFGCEPGYDDGRCMALDKDDNAFITGYTTGSLFATNAGSSDVFLRKYDSAGDVQWSKQIGTSSGEWGNAVAADTDGNAYIAGWTKGSLCGSNLGSSDVFVKKYDSAGNVLWSRQFGTSTTDESTGLAVDGDGNLYVAGWTTGNLGGTNLGGYDNFLRKYDSAGNVLWTRQFGTSGYDYAQEVAVDAEGNAFFVGASDGATSTSTYDTLLAKFDPSGNPLWSDLRTSNDGIDWAQGVDVDPDGDVYSAGYTFGSLCGPNLGMSDFFLMKYAAPRLPGDANHDGLVNDADAAVLASNWLTPTGAGWSDGDFNEDGAVDDRDAAILAAHWQRNAENASVPEPSCAVLLTALIVISCLLGRRRKER